MRTLPQSLRIGIIRGGPTPEYEISIESGANVIKHLSLTHKPIDIFISREGKWHMHGLERSPDRILKNVDVVFNAIHGPFGEDGRLQEILNNAGVPYTGSSRYASSIALNKWVTKQHAKAVGVKTPVSVLVRRGDSIADKAKEVFDLIPHPLIVKPISGGSSIGIKVADSFNDLLSALENILEKYEGAVVEEHIVGKQVSCFITNDFRDLEVYVFPVMENLTKEESRAVEEIAKKMHGHLGLSQYSKSDFIVSPRRGIYFLESNTVPKVTNESLLLKTLESVGVSVAEFLHHVIGLAIGKK